MLTGGISRDSRAESPAISKDFRPAKPSRNSKLGFTRTCFVTDVATRSPTDTSFDHALTLRV